MNKSSNTTETVTIDYFLDITDATCPMTFVKTKLMVERMAVGEVVEVRLRGAEPLENVPRSITQHGHEILSLAPEDEDGPADGVHRLRVLKKE